MRSIFLCFFSLFLPSFLYSQTDNIGSGHAISFDGIDDYIDLGNIYDDLSLPFSVSAWIYIDPETTVAGPVFVSQDNDPIYNGFWFFATPTALFIEYGDGRGENLPAYRKGKTTPVSFMKGRWNHVCAVMKGAYDIDLYVNGFNVGGGFSGDSDQPMASEFPNDVAKIGYFLSNGVTYRFKGIMDELRVWNYALTENQVRQSMCKKLTGQEPGLIGYWTFDETTGNILNDKSLKHFSGQLKGNPKRVFSGAPVGDESVFTYTNAWTGKSLSLLDDDYKIAVNNIRGNPEGIHLYSVNGVPSQTAGLNLSDINEPYFGVFVASGNDDNLFDASLTYKGTESCEVFSRADNSISAWTTASLPLKDKLQRTEFIFLPGTPVNLNLGADKVLCGASSHTLSTGITDPEISFQWSSGQNTPQIVVTKTGSYWVKASSSCGSISDTVNIIIEKIPKDIAFPEDEVLCTISPRILNPVSDTEGLDFTWQDGSKQPTYEVTDFGQYWVVVKNACGEVRGSINFSKINFTDGAIPNVITPNGDPYNERFLVDEKIKGLVSFEVFNRWGSLIYSAPQYNNDWSGANLASGIYFYRLLGNCIGEKKGSISILK
ncbi:MAG TPA: LamG-like jellyroll fold domain-containing protein [Chryseolinea sp.]|nr:LamG-like jellyroll fold domain-containing protein [Chryseolinea sp.]